ncbi:MAG: hypothetical protein P8Y71_01890 [Pseudolabrys sp.]
MDDTNSKPRMTGGTRDRLSGLCVLFLPKNSRTEYFASFMASGREHYAWRIHVVCPRHTNGFWSGRLGAETTFSAVPDFARPQPLEDDAEAVKKLDGYIARCERTNGLSAGRIVLAGERDIGRGFSRHAYHWFQNNIARAVLADTTQPSWVLRRIFGFARDVLDSVKPDLVVAGEWAEPLCFAFLMAAREAGISCAVNRRSKIWSGRCYWSNEPLMYNHRARDAVAEKRRVGAEVSERARAHLEAFRSNPKTLGYVRKNWAQSERRRWFGRHVDLIRLFGAQIKSAVAGGTGQRPKPALQLFVEHYRRAWLKWRQKRFFCRLSANDLQDLRYVYLAFHKDPEQALNYQASFWVNQHNTAALLSGALPAGYKLLVREHRLNAGRRPNEFYKELLRLPQLVLIDAYDNQFKYIANADLIVTDNGSTGWEGLVLGRHVITLADNFYAPADLDHRVREPEHLAREIVAMLDRPPVQDAAAHDRALGWLIDAEWQTTSQIEEGGSARAFDLLAEVLPSKHHSSRIPLSA